MNQLISEVVRNAPGYFLVILGLLALYLGGHVGQVKLQDAGFALVTASLLAFQAKRSPDVPPPPPPPETPAIPKQ